MTQQALPISLFKIAIKLCSKNGSPSLIQLIIVPNMPGKYKLESIIKSVAIFITVKQ